MRIVLSNPDTIGDFVLRQPMLSALGDEGHELLLVVRDFVAPLAKAMFPNAQLALCRANPYLEHFTPDPLLLAQAREFAPDVFVVASFQHTRLEESLATELRGVRSVIGFSGYLFPEADSVISFTRKVMLDRDVPEVEKNRRLCQAILGRPVQLAHPKLRASEAATQEARARLAEVGVDGGNFWAVAAGDVPNTRVRNWDVSQWAQFCRELVYKHNARLVFIGTPDEHEATVAIQQAMGEAAVRTATVTGQAMSLDGLVGVLALAEGYIGRDTGPMHLAAALGKPVLCVFGGGTWPRFIPAAERGAVFTVRMPCTGCGWRCHLTVSHCVKDVPVETVLAAAAKLLAGEGEGFQVEVLNPPESEPNNCRVLLQRKEEELRAVLALIPDLRDELAALRAENEALLAERDSRLIPIPLGRLAAWHRKLDALAGGRLKPVTTAILRRLGKQ